MGKRVSGGEGGAEAAAAELEGRPVGSVFPSLEGPTWLSETIEAARAAELEGDVVAETLRDLLALEGGLERVEELRLRHAAAARVLELFPFSDGRRLEAVTRRGYSSKAAELIGRRRAELVELLEAVPVTAYGCEDCMGETRSVGGRVGLRDLLSCGHWVPAAVVLGGEVVPVLELEGRAAVIDQAEEEPAELEGAEYELRYLGETIDGAWFATDGEARAWRLAFVRRLMADEMPSYLTSDDFESFDDCLRAHRLIRVGGER